MLWSFIKTHINSKIIVFLSTCKQVKFVFEIFKKLRPGIPLRCLHGRMKQEVRLAIYSQFCEKRSVLFSTDIASRGLDFPSVDWVVQFDCHEDISTYIHRVGRTARFSSKGKSLLFLLPSEREMFKELQAAEAKIPVIMRRPSTDKLQSISDTLAATLAKFPNLNELAQNAFVRYCRSMYKQKDKEIFDVLKLPLDELAQSLGLPITPKIRFVTKMKGQKEMRLNDQTTHDEDSSEKDNCIQTKGKIIHGKTKFVDDEENELFSVNHIPQDGTKSAAVVLPTRISKKKMKLNKPIGTRVVFDDEGNAQAPLAALAVKDDALCELDTQMASKVKNERYMKLREEVRQHDRDDKFLLKKRLRDGRTKEKIKIKRRREEAAGDSGSSGSDDENQYGGSKTSKIYFDSDSDDGKRTGKQSMNVVADSISLAQQEALALKLLNSMHS